MRLVKTVIAWSVVVAWSLPLIGLIVASFEPMHVVVEGWWTLREFTLGNYAEVLGKGFANHLAYSAVISLGAVAIPIAASAMMAYGFARFSFRLKTALFLLLVALQVIPQQMVIVPLLILTYSVASAAAQLNEAATYLAWITLIHSAYATPWIVFFLRNFLQAIPREYEEAALVDGLSTVQTLFKVVLPIMRPALISVAIVQFIWVWHDLLFAVMFLPQDYWPATAAVTTFVSRYNPNWGALTASSVLTIVAPLAIFIALQKYYFRGVAGGLKA